MSGLILYEVVIIVAPEIRADYLVWLHAHMDKMLTFDGFDAAEVFVNSEDENEITCHYRLRGIAAMQAYLAGPAREMRADGVNRFGDKMSATRRILRIQQNPFLRATKT